MKKLISFTCFLLAAMITFGQSKSKPKAPKNLFTAKYAGYYGLGKNAEKERVASFIVYPETDSTALFYFESNAGPPDYSMGSYYGRVIIKGDTAIFYKKPDPGVDTSCKWKLLFAKKKLIVQTMHEKYNCGFGHDVVADGEFKQESSDIIDECLDLGGQAINFRTLKPEDYKYN